MLALAVTFIILWGAIVAGRIARFGQRALDEPPAPASAIVVLGAGVDGHEPSPIFEARLRHGVELYRQGLAPYLLLTGGLGTEKKAAESEVGKTYAMAAGVPESAILIETVSETTFQNLQETDRLLDENGLDRKIILVSDPYHLQRAVVMAKRLKLEPQVSATPTTQFCTWKTRLPFLMRETYFLHHFLLFRQ